MIYAHLSLQYAIIEGPKPRNAKALVEHGLLQPGCSLTTRVAISIPLSQAVESKDVSGIFKGCRSGEKGLRVETLFDTEQGEGKKKQSWERPLRDGDNNS